MCICCCERFTFHISPAWESMARVRPGFALPGIPLETSGDPSSARHEKPAAGRLPQLKPETQRHSVGELEGADAANRAPSWDIPAHGSISTVRAASRSVWSSNRWLEECRAGLKATESLCWSQLLQSLTGEPVKWTPKGPNKRQLARKAVKGILARQSKPTKADSKDSVEDRKDKREGSNDIVEDLPEHPLSKGSINNSLSCWAKLSEYDMTRY